MGQEAKPDQKLLLSAQVSDAKAEEQLASAMPEASQLSSRVRGAEGAGFTRLILSALQTRRRWVPWVFCPKVLLVRAILAKRQPLSALRTF